MDCEQIPDPDLTRRGREQCERLREEFPYHDQVDFIMASPIRRTIQTAVIGLAPVIEKKGLKIVLTPRAQETSSKPSDTGSPISKLEEEFGDKIDTRRMTESWNSNKGEWSMDTEYIERHVVELRHYIHNLNYEHVVLVAHGGVSLLTLLPLCFSRLLTMSKFMHYFTEDWSDCPGMENETGWANTEFRSYEFLEGNGAHLRELKESRERRAERAAGGFREHNGPADQQ